MIFSDENRAAFPSPSAGEGGPRRGSGEGSAASGEVARRADGPASERVRRFDPIDRGLRNFARGQRATMTVAEAAFWQQVRGGRFRGLEFKWQAPINPYIVDFLCASARLIVELDGAPHETEARRRRDAERDAWLRAQGFEVRRFTNDLVLSNLGAVLDAVGAAVDVRVRRDPSGTVAPLSRPLLTQGPPSPAEGGGRSRASC